MRPSVALIALLSLCVCACSRGAPPPHSSAPAHSPATAQAPRAATPAPQQEAPPSAQNETQQATEAQESGADDAPQSGDTSLERMAALPPDQQLPGGRWKAGVNYDAVVPAQPTSVGAGKVEVIEVFWLGCPHCYALEPYVQKWLKSKPDYITFVRVPVMWGPVHQAHARLYYTLQALGRLDLFEKTFDTIQRENNPLVANTEDATLKLDVDFATANGIKADDFTKAYRSFAVEANLRRAQQLTERYNITGVPTVVVNGKYETDVGKAGSPEKLFALADDLAAAEHRH